MAAKRVVSLKGEKADGPTEHFVRLRRGENGAGFVVGYVDHSGREDFRTQAEYSTYAEALKAAQSRAQDVRRPLKDDTGVESEEKPRPSKARETKAVPTGRAMPAMRKADDTKPVRHQFNLPNIDERIKAIDCGPLIDRAFASFEDARHEYLAIHAQRYGDSRDHTVAFTQRVYDQVQGQLRSLYVEMAMASALQCATLEQAFARIEQLEQAPKGLNYRGVYHQDESYAPQDCVTWGGSMWVAKESTTEKPGGPESPWVLACKKGRDGKDLRHAVSA